MAPESSAIASAALREGVKLDAPPGGLPVRGARLVGFALVRVLPLAAAWVVFIGILVAALLPAFYSLVLYKWLKRQGRFESPANSPEGSSQEVCAG